MRNAGLKFPVDRRMLTSHPLRDAQLISISILGVVRPPAQLDFSTHTPSALSSNLLPSQEVAGPLPLQVAPTESPAGSSAADVYVLLTFSGETVVTASMQPSTRTSVHHDHEPSGGVVDDARTVWELLTTNAETVSSVRARNFLKMP